MTKDKNNCLVVLGPTASGKTRFACQLAYELNGEIISADSRQVYKHLIIGTGKDLNEYEINGTKIPYHLIDIKEPGDQFYLHEFMDLCGEAFLQIRNKNKLPIICGGTGLYLDSLRKDFSFTQVKENGALREKLQNFSKEELENELKRFPAALTAHADTGSVKRMMRAIEVAAFLQDNPGTIAPAEKPYHPFYIGMAVSVEERKKRIRERLLKRVNEGLAEETENLLKHGLSHERLQFLGLEYKFTSLYLQNIIKKDEWLEQLQTAIFQFSKRQMTWFRKMEKEGVNIHWVKPNEPLENIVNLFKMASE